VRTTPFNVFSSQDYDHVDWLEVQVHQIKEMGYERYLTMQDSGPKD